MIQTYTETIKGDGLFNITLIAYLDNEWTIREDCEIPTILNKEDFQAHKNLCVGEMYERFNKNIQGCIRKPQSEGTLPPTELNSKAILKIK